MRRKLAALALLAAVALLAPGCTFRQWADDVVNHGKVILRDLNDIHRSVDRHFFNYDWNDPTL